MGRVTLKLILPYAKWIANGICCMAQESQTGVLHQSRGLGYDGRWEGVSKGRGYMYSYSWFMLRFDRKQQNTVKQLSFNKKINENIF